MLIQNFFNWLLLFVTLEHILKKILCATTAWKTSTTQEQIWEQITDFCTVGIWFSHNYIISETGSKKSSKLWSSNRSWQCLQYSKKCCILKPLYPLKLFVLFKPWTSQVLMHRVACAPFLSDCVAGSGQKQQNKFEFIGKVTQSAVTWCLLSCLFA